MNWLVKFIPLEFGSIKIPAKSDYFYSNSLIIGAQVRESLMAESVIIFLPFNESTKNESAGTCFAW